MITVAPGVGEITNGAFSLALGAPPISIAKLSSSAGSKKEFPKNDDVVLGSSGCCSMEGEKESPKIDDLCFSVNGAWVVPLVLLPKKEVLSFSVGGAEVVVVVAVVVVVVVVVVVEVVGGAEVVGGDVAGWKILLLGILFPKIDVLSFSWGGAEVAGSMILGGADV